MIPLLLKLLQKLAAALEAAAARELAKADAKLKFASALVQEANGHRNGAKTAQAIASTLKDTTTPPQ